VTVAILALRGAAAVLVLATMVGGIPPIARAALAAAAGLWSALLVAPAHPTYVSFAFVAQELAIGAALGVSAAIPVLAAQTAGRLVDVTATGRAQGTYTLLFGVLAAAVFVGVDGHVITVRAIVMSHRALPVVAAVEPGVRAAIAALVPSAIQLALPWLVTVAVVQIAVGAGTRLAGRAGAHVPGALAVPAALVMMTASLVATLALAIAALTRSIV
jgi:flagellar biosynthesis protein FliR